MIYGCNENSGAIFGRCCGGILTLFVPLDVLFVQQDKVPAQSSRGFPDDCAGDCCVLLKSYYKGLAFILLVLLRGGALRLVAFAVADLGAQAVVAGSTSLGDLICNEQTDGRQC